MICAALTAFAPTVARPAPATPIRNTTTNNKFKITFTTPEEIRKINKKYRKIDRATDVLSFPMFEKEELDEKIWADSCNRKIIYFIALGFRIKEICQELHLSEAAINKRIHKMKKFMGVKEVSGLLKEAKKRIIERKQQIH